MSGFEVALGVQIAVLVVAWLARGWKVAAGYVGLLLLTWFLTLELVSGHIGAAIHLLWIVPMLFALWAVSKPLRVRLSTKTTETRDK
jgi:hypothetical protein